MSLAEFILVGRPVPRPRPAGLEALYESTIKRNSEPLALLFLSRKFKSCKTLRRASIARFTCPQRRRAAHIQRNALIQIFQLEN